MRKNIQSGFTLIELVVVIVILGILAATALPRFINLSDEANVAALQGVAGALSSASSINYAARLANPARGAPVGNCTDVGALVIPAVGAAELSGGTTTAGEAANCVITRGTNSVTFTAIGS